MCPTGWRARDSQPVSVSEVRSTPTARTNASSSVSDAPRSSAIDVTDANTSDNGDPVAQPLHHFENVRGRGRWWRRDGPVRAEYLSSGGRLQHRRLRRRLIHQEQLQAMDVGAAAASRRVCASLEYSAISFLRSLAEFEQIQQLDPIALALRATPGRRRARRIR